MCQEVKELVQHLDLRKMESRLSLHCAPVITGIKTSNLLVINSREEDALRNLLRHSGLSYFRMLRSQEKTYFLLFRREKLESYLRKPEVSDMLQELGYTNFSFGYILRNFQKRYLAYMEKGEEFPHEMGLLLGYPYEDVKGFMEHEGRDSLYTGYWKVYHNLPEKKRLFRKYEEAEETLIRLLAANTDFRLILEIYKTGNPARIA